MIENAAFLVSCLAIFWVIIWACKQDELSEQDSDQDSDL